MEIKDGNIMEHVTENQLKESFNSNQNNTQTFKALEKESIDAIRKTDTFHSLGNIQRPWPNCTVTGRYCDNVGNNVLIKSSKHTIFVFQKNELNTTLEKNSLYEIKVDEKGIIKTTRLNQELDSLRTTQSFKDLGEKGNLFPANTKNGKYTGKIVDNVDNHYLLKISSKTIIAIKQDSIPNDLDVKKNVSIDFRDNVSIVSYVEPKKDTKQSKSIKR